MNYSQRLVPDRFDNLIFCQIRPDRRDEDWRTVQERLGGNPPLLSDWGMEILREGLKEHVKSVLIEPFYVCKDHRNLYSHFYSKKFQPPSPFCSRLHFFGVPPPEAEHLFKLDPTPFENAYIGYSVVRPVADRCLGRTVIDPDRIGMDVGRRTFCLRTPFRVHVGGLEFSVKGYPYVSQDADATVCAHSALWSVCRYFSERYSAYKEIHPFDLVQMTGHTRGRTFPYRGMTYEDYSSILSQFGVFPIVLRMKESHADKNLIAERWQDVCAYVESGYPLLASLYPENSGHGHVVALIGHTLDFNRCLPPRQDFVDSSVFFDRLVVSDDNFFPYQLLGFKGDLRNYACAYPEGFSLNSMVTAVCPLPEKAFMPADIARKICMRLLETGPIRARLDAIGKPPWICRLLMSTGSSFRAAKLGDARAIGRDGFADTADYAVSKMNLPHFIWIMQLAPLETYKRFRAMAEIVIDTTAGKYEESVLYVRIGDEILPNVGAVPGEEAGQKRQIKGIRFVQSARDFPLYRHNLGTEEKEKP